MKFFKLGNRREDFGNMEEPSNKQATEHKNRQETNIVQNVGLLRRDSVRGSQ